MNDDIRLCTNCKHCLHQDYGYSNWTVEGTTISCLLSHQESHDEYREDELSKWAQFAKSCPDFVQGVGYYIDCDHEEATRGNIEGWLELNPDISPAAVRVLRSMIDD